MKVQLRVIVNELQWLSHILWFFFFWFNVFVDMHAHFHIWIFLTDRFAQCCWNFMMCSSFSHSCILTRAFTSILVLKVLNVYVIISGRFHLDNCIWILKSVGKNWFYVCSFDVCESDSFGFLRERNVLWCLFQSEEVYIATYDGLTIAFE